MVDIFVTQANPGIYIHSHKDWKLVYCSSDDQGPAMLVIEEKLLWNLYQTNTKKITLQVKLTEFYY